jgi:hypothetical protein
VVLESIASHQKLLEATASRFELLRGNPSDALERRLRRFGFSAGVISAVASRVSTCRFQARRFERGANIPPDLCPCSDKRLS